MPEPESRKEQSSHRRARSITRIIQCDALQIVGIILIAYVILHFIIKFWVTPQPTLPTAALAHGKTTWRNLTGAARSKVRGGA